ncbi:MAG TPA: hypothetical protein VMT27_09830 [Actinomycetes bacterium]|nr:hypothetical protein [Actinomycetes bacterium]
MSFPHTVVEEPVTVTRQRAYCEHRRELKATGMMRASDPPTFEHVADDQCLEFLDTTYPRILHRPEDT